jgi:FkbM family methyltransferase
MVVSVGDQVRIIKVASTRSTACDTASLELPPGLADGVALDTVNVPAQEAFDVDTRTTARRKSVDRGLEIDAVMRQSDGRKDAVRSFAKQFVRRFGVEVRRLDPNATLGVFTTTLFRDVEINCVMDVGANTGQFAQMLRGEGYKGHIVSVEPVAEAYAQLEANARGDSRWRTVQLALGATDGEASINVPGGTNMSSFRAPDSEALGKWSFVSDATRMETVRIARLDSVLDELAPNLDNLHIYLKLDTQGWDLEVMKGAEASLERVVAIQTELSFKRLYAEQPMYVESLELFRDLGYEIAGFFPIVRDRNWALIEADCVLVRHLDGKP